MKKRIIIIYTLLALVVIGLTVFAAGNQSPKKEIAEFSINTNDPTIDKFFSLPTGQIQMDGFMGNKLDLCIDNRILKQSIEDFVMPFDVRDEPRWGWRGEFWGKWYTSAVLGYQYRPDEMSKQKIDRAVSELLKTQSDDGYIGTSPHEDRINGNWDIWGRKYVLLGLIAYYDETGSDDVLDAAIRHADRLIYEVGAESGNNISETGWVGWKGLASSSVLEPISLLYQRTGEQRFLDFAIHIVSTWDTPNKLSPNGLRLIQGALEGREMWKMGDAPKAYEMTSCFEGLLELYRITSNELYLNASIAYADNIIKYEITPIGSGSMAEIWCNTKLRQTEPMYEAMETCATVTWMKFLYQLLRLTGDSKYADQLEYGLYNALLASMTPDGEWWSYFTGLMGERTFSHLQFVDMASSCCVVNGPRGLMITPGWAVMSFDDGVVFNLYESLTAEVNTPAGNSARFAVQSDYPKTENIRIKLNLEENEAFALKLRIPEWSKNNSIKINGRNYNGLLIPGTYATIKRDWSSNDVVELNLDLRTKIHDAPAGTGDQLLRRGPIVLAFDSRLAKQERSPSSYPMFRYEFMSNHLDNQYIDVELVESTNPKIWMTFNVPLKDEAGNPHIKQMVDFASAGNEWQENNIFRTWIQQPFDVRHLYIKLDWKANTSPSQTERPIIPNAYRLE